MEYGLRRTEVSHSVDAGGAVGAVTGVGGLPSSEIEVSVFTREIKEFLFRAFPLLTNAATAARMRRLTVRA